MHTLSTNSLLQLFDKHQESGHILQHSGSLMLCLSLTSLASPYARFEFEHTHGKMYLVKKATQQARQEMNKSLTVPFIPVQGIIMTSSSNLFRICHPLNAYRAKFCVRAYEPCCSRPIWPCRAAPRNEIKVRQCQMREFDEKILVSTFEPKTNFEKRTKTSVQCTVRWIYGGDCSNPQALKLTTERLYTHS